MKLADEQKKQLTDKELEILKRVEAATEGPWYWWMSEEPPFDLGTKAEIPDPTRIGISVSTMPNAEFVASAPDDIMLLLATVADLRTEIAALQVGR